MKGWLSVMAGIGWLATSSVGLAQLSLQRYGHQPDLGGPLAVRVSGGDLLHTAQLVPLGSDGEVLAGGVEEQLEALAEQLRRLIESSGGDWRNLVRLNFVAATPEAAEAIRERFQRMPSDVPRPSLTLAVSPLSDRRASVAVDAVLAIAADVGAASAEPPSARSFGGGWGAAWRRQSAGGVVYISGQAEAGDGSLSGATAATLASLGATLDWLGLKSEQVLAVRCFLSPIADQVEVERQLARFFSGRALPVVSHVEWISSLPIEIEWVVAAAGQTPPGEVAGERLQMLTPPGMSSSPIFSRVAWLKGGPLIFTSSLIAEPADASGAAEVEAAFGTLEAILAEAGGDLRHLAKATYFVASEPVSSQLNQLRPRYYDPSRPPAASKAMVAGTGVADRFLAIDFIATTPALQP
jgi:enamine deaminase RidA (YjgF/YER057c/UK114 family)